MTEIKNKNLVARPPVVVILGHVDHGKSSILEAVKDFKITEKESGGITQHIGAYQIEEKNKKITFIDTPGHEAFSAMRARGTQVADVAVLVVAGEEGVKPQTKEAISFVRESGIPMIVAINKIDKPEAQPEKVKKELAQNDILVESMGGKIPSVEVSAKTGQGISDLLEVISLVAEMEDLKADRSKPAQGAVIEAFLDPLRGPAATLILRDGILKKGEIIMAPFTLGKVKILEDFQGNSIEQALPSMPCLVIGFEKVPWVGGEFKTFSDVELAKEYLQKKERKTEPGEVLVIEPGKKVLNLILKADVLGSVEAIKAALKNLPQERVVIRVVKAGVGRVNESDLKLALASKAIVLAFRTGSEPQAQKLVRRERIKIINFEVIYELVQKVRELMGRKIGPEIVRKDLGKVKILAIFRTGKEEQIVGGKVIEGEAGKGKVEIYREEELLGRGKIVNLQKDKKNIDKAEKGKECGMLYRGEVKVEPGDVFHIYLEEKRKELEESLASLL